MPFRLWHYAVKFLAIPLFVCIFIGMLVHSPVPSLLAHTAIALLVCLAFIGAVMGILMTFGKLRMRCPFCGESGDAWGSKAEGMRMRCPKCGLIRTGGVFGLKLFREQTEANSEPRGPTAE